MGNNFNNSPVLFDEIFTQKPLADVNYMWFFTVSVPFTPVEILHSWFVVFDAKDVYSNIKKKSKSDWLKKNGLFC